MVQNLLSSLHTGLFRIAWIVEMGESLSLKFTTAP
jgi:hypothetical protein